MQTVQLMIKELADEAGIIRPAYDPYPVSNSESFLEDDEWRWDEIRQAKLEKKLSAEVRFKPLPHDSADDLNKPPRPMTLLDYLYFMIYTITTTGYGDLVPSSAAARFLVSMANLYELFFLVIIFNAVQGLRYDDNGNKGRADAKTGAKTGGDGTDEELPASTETKSEGNQEAAAKTVLEPPPTNDGGNE